ncbi:MAG: alpha/beta hydrolase [Clostridiaceae bacterium]
MVTTLAIILIIIIILLFAGLYFYNYAILRSKKEFIDSDEELQGLKDPKKQGYRDWFKDQPFENVSITSYDNLKLSAAYLKNNEKSNKTVILVHGYAGHRNDMYFISRFYYEKLGFNLLIPDLRGHGKSEGNYIGMGWKDRMDILKWIDYIGDGSQIVLHGISMGGGTVLMVSGESLPSNVKCIISDCAFSGAKEILSYQLKRMFKLPKFPLIYLTSFICKLRAGYYFGEACALKQIEKSKTPILFIHGDEDKFVPTEMVYPLYEALNTEKKLVIVPGAGHVEAYWEDKELYEKEVEDFIDRFVVEE